MKKLRLFLLSVLTAAAAFGADTALARAEYVKRIESCEAVLRELQMNPATAIPADILAQARGLVITNQVRAGIILGVKDGYGVVMVKRPSGQWSVPAFLKAGEASIGLQLGASAVCIVDNLCHSRLANKIYAASSSTSSTAASAAASSSGFM